MKEPELVTATHEQFDEILHQAKPALSEQQYRLLEGVLGTFVFVMLKMHNAKTSIKRLQQMLFGQRAAARRRSRCCRWRRWFPRRSGRAGGAAA